MLIKEYSNILLLGPMTPCHLLRYKIYQKYINNRKLEIVSYFLINLRKTRNIVKYSYQSGNTL